MDPITLSLIAFALVTASYALIAVNNAGKSQRPKPASLEEFEFPQSEEGKPQIVVFGDVWLDDWFVIWWGNLVVQENTKKVKKK